MSSHREAPEISKDPVADSTDLYAFTSYGNPDNVTIIANYVPLQAPDGGPNFYEFGDDVLYEIKIDNNGDGKADVTYQFTFTTQVTNPNTFLYNTGPILSLTDKNWNRRQTFTVVRVDGRRARRRRSATTWRVRRATSGRCRRRTTRRWSTARDPHARPAAARCSPASAPRASTSTSARSSTSASCGRSSSCTRRSGSQNTGLGAMAAGVNSTKGVNVHSIAIEVPKTDADQGRRQARPTRSSPASVIGVWTSASRQKARVLKAGGTDVASGPYVQVSRLGNPLVNEVVVPMSKKDYWNSQEPADDKQFTPAVLNPELAQLLPVLYPGVFPNLEAYNKGTPKRDDLVAIFHTGLPGGVVPGFQNSMGTVQADMLRLNLAIPPTTPGRRATSG